MSAVNCCSAGFEISNNFYGPEFVFWEKHQWSRCAKIPLAFLSGVIKPFLFPVWALVGAVVFPILAIVRAIGGEGNFLNRTPSDYMKAWSFSLLAVAGVIGLMILSSTVLPLVGTSAVVLIAFTVSITIHVYRASQCPNKEIFFD